MPSPWAKALHNLRDRIDADLLTAVYRSVGLPTDLLRAELDAAGLPRIDRDAKHLPSAAELEAAVAQIVATASREATLRGGLGAALGLIALPPEALVALAQTVRLTQRLAVLYGHDPDTDGGALVVARALAAGMGLDLPQEGQLALRVHEVRALVRPNRDAGSDMAEALALRTVVSLGKRAFTYIPGIGAGLGAVLARRSVRVRAARMVEVLSRISDAPALLGGPVEEAEELPADGGHTASPR